MRFQISLCRELGYTLTELREKETAKALQVWYLVRCIEQDEARQAKLNAEVLADFEANKAKANGR